MEYIEFTQKYPLLNEYLIELAANRIAQTSDYLESEVKGKIYRLQLEADRKRDSMIVWKEFPNGITATTLERIANTDPEYRYLVSEIEQAKLDLKLIKTTNVTPSQQQLIQATEQVKQYVEALQYPSIDTVLKWSHLSVLEKHYLRVLGDMFRSEAVLTIWDTINSLWYTNIGYEILTEPVKESHFKNDRLVAYITSNSYGVLCLNAPSVMFVDIDCDIDADDVTYLAYPWGRQDVTEAEIIDKINLVAKACELKFCVYRTRNGFRLLETSQEWNPRSPSSKEILDAVGSDHLFQNLCYSQKTYRARLQPKPWRIETGNHSVCQYLGTIGTTRKRNAIALHIKSIHDKYCLSSGSLA